jgi:hypothetical protein
MARKIPFPSHTCEYIQGVPRIVAFINNDIEQLIFFSSLAGFATLLKLVKICQKFKA